MLNITHQDRHDIPLITTEEGTRKLGSINTDLLSFNSISGDAPLDGSCVMLFMPDSDEPLALWNIATVILGRADNHSETQPNIDLSNHHAKLLGVSRLHAEIFYRDGNYFVRDLGSTNGTWINEDQLEPHKAMRLLNGDSLRLGHLMIQIGGC